MKKILLLATFLTSISLLSAQPLLRATPEEMGVDGKRLSRADAIIEHSIELGEIPGAVLAVVRGDKMIYLKSYGDKSLYPKKEKMEVETIFDLASVSKSVGTAIAIMQLVEEGKLRLTDNVSLYIPGFKGYVDPENGKKEEIRVIELLTHSSGLPPYAPTEELIAKYGSPNPEGLLTYIANCKRDFKPTTQFQYSCLNFITLQHIVEKITATTLANYVEQNIFQRLGMVNSSYNPDPKLYPQIAPTEKEPDGSVILGRVHDPLARLLNDGNSGNAGVFSNAEDLAILSAALMGGGEYNGKRILAPLTVERMTQIPRGFEKLGRSLGWDNYSPYASNNGNLFDPVRTYGHTGYTGTSLIIDPVANVAVILLANRVHPVDSHSVVRLRALVANVIAGAIIK